LPAFACPSKCTCVRVFACSCVSLERVRGKRMLASLLSRCFFVYILYCISCLDTRVVPFLRCGCCVCARARVCVYVCECVSVCLSLPSFLPTFLPSCLPACLPAFQGALSAAAPPCIAVAGRAHRRARHHAWRLGDSARSRPRVQPGGDVQHRG